MTDTQAAESGTVDTTAAAEAAVSSQEERNFEAEARKIGWVPEEEFKGDKKPARFKTAQEFVEDGENLTPHLKRIIAAQVEDRLARIEKVNAKTIAAITEMHKGEIASLKAQRTEAIKAGNEGLVDAIDTEIEKRKDATPTKGEAADINAEFAKQHDWYGTDEELTAIAIGFSQDVLAAAEKAGRVISMEDMFEAVAKKVKVSSAYKSKFPDERKAAANGHAAVDGGSDAPAPSRSDPFAKLSAVERAKATEDMKAYPKVYPNKQAWLDAYTS